MSLTKESDYRVRHLREQAASGLSVAEYCRRRELCAATFYAWRRSHREALPGRRSPAGAVSFTEIGRVAAGQPQWAAEIALPSGVVVRVSSAADAQLLRVALEALG